MWGGPAAVRARVVRRQITLLVAATTRSCCWRSCSRRLPWWRGRRGARAGRRPGRGCRSLIPSVGLDQRVRGGRRTWPPRPSEQRTVGCGGPTGMAGAGRSSGTTSRPPPRPWCRRRRPRLVQPVRRSDGTAVIEVFVPTEQLRAGVTRTWLVLAGLGLTLLVLALVVADRLARSLTRPVDRARRPRRSGCRSGDLSARGRRRPGRRRCGRWAWR